MDLLPWEALVISIHTLHTEGDTTCPHYDDMDGISIHTLHTEGDLVIHHVESGFHVRFQSTPSTRRVTANTNNYITFVHLSIIQSIL